MKKRSLSNTNPNDKRELLKRDLIVYALLIEAEKKRGYAYTDDELDYLIQIMYTSNMISRRPYTWIDDLLYVVISLDEGHEENLFIDSFYIKLHGVLSEVYQYYGKLVENIKGLGAYDKYEESSLGKMVIAILSSIEKLKGMFSEEELVYIDIQRQLAGHVNPTGFEITYDVKSRKLNRVYKGKDAVEIDNIIANLERIYGSKLKVTQHLNQKIKHQLALIHHQVQSVVTLK